VVEGGISGEVVLMGSTPEKLGKIKVAIFRGKLRDPPVEHQAMAPTNEVWRVQDYESELISRELGAGSVIQRSIVSVMIGGYTQLLMADSLDFGGESDLKANTTNDPDHGFIAYDDDLVDPWCSFVFSVSSPPLAKSHHGLSGHSTVHTNVYSPTM
jgi:hypothetical protein